MWIFEPHVAEAVFESFVKDYQIPVHRNEWLDRENGVTKDGARITTIQMLSGKTYQGRMFIDATYEGDLMAAAGVDYHVGRESTATYGETWNGVQTGVLHHGHWFKSDTDPFKTPGDPSSGLLPEVSGDPPGEKGAGDKRIQAYCYRMCLTDADENRIPFPRPDNYDPARYELLLRVFNSGWRETFNKFDPIPNRKTDTNNHGPFSTDHIGANYDYPEASYERRQEILTEHERYQKGLMYFIANDPRVPADVREPMAKWGLAKDEFTDNGGWPHQIYVREARRLIGEYVMTEQDCMDEKRTPQSVGMGSYTLDSHNVQRYVKPDGFVQNEGDIGVKPPAPYEIAYGSLVPKKNQCENLLVPICVSSSHIAFGSIRMEPVFMILGESAATAAGMAIDEEISVQDVPYDKLKARLLEQGQVLAYDGPRNQGDLDLSGTVIDDAKATLAGAWVTSGSIKPYHGGGYQHDGDANKGACEATFETALEPGKYEVRLIYQAHANRASNVPVTILHANGKATATLDQRKPPRSLGQFQFNGTGVVTIANAKTDGYVVIDAVQFVLIK